MQYVDDRDDFELGGVGVDLEELLIGVPLVIALWSLAALAVVGAARHLRGRGSRLSTWMSPEMPQQADVLVPAPAGVTPMRPTPQSILDERLARGEIEPEDHRQRSEALRESSRVAD